MGIDSCQPFYIYLCNCFSAEFTKTEEGCMCAESTQNQTCKPWASMLLQRPSEVLRANLYQHRRSSISLRTKQPRGSKYLRVAFGGEKRSKYLLRRYLDPLGIHLGYICKACALTRAMANPSPFDILNRRSATCSVGTWAFMKGCTACPG